MVVITLFKFAIAYHGSGAVLPARKPALGIFERVAMNFTGTRQPKDRLLDAVFVRRDMPQNRMLEVN
jgi:hypothetical protein